MDKLSIQERALQMFCLDQTGCFKRKLLAGLLLLYVALSSSAQAEIWHRTTTDGMRNVAVAPSGLIWLTDEKGGVWKSDNIYGSSLTKVDGRERILNRIAVGPDGIVWAIGRDGALWRYDNDWLQTEAREMEDVAIASDGKIWLVGKNGAIWSSNDQGSTFLQIKMRGFHRIAVGRGETVWVVGTDGLLWKYAADCWTQMNASEIADVAVTPNGLIWLVDQKGKLLRSADGGVTFTQDEHATEIENIAAGRGGAWAVGLDGRLWRKLFSPQF